MSTLLSVSLALLAGLLMTRLFKPLKLPSVTAYLIAGVLIGPYCIGALGLNGVGFNSHESVEALSLISEVALGFIAFSIGNEFRLEDLKKTGKQAFTIGIFQALVATLFVDLALFVVHLMMPDKLTLPQVLTLGAIATATAPAATATAPLYERIRVFVGNNFAGMFNVETIISEAVKDDRFPIMDTAFFGYFIVTENFLSTR